MSFSITNTELAGKFVAMLKGISVLCDTITIRFTSDRLVAQGMDSSHCSLFEFKLEKDWFTEYTVEAETVVSLNLAIISKIVAMRQPKQEVAMCVSGDKFEIEYKSEVADEFNRAFAIPTVDIECEVMEIPERDSEVDLTLMSSKFAQIVNQMSVFGDVIDFATANDDMTMVTEGDQGTMRVGLDETDLEEFSITEGTVLHQSFALRYLAMFAAFSKVNSFVRLSLTEDNPIIAKYPLDVNVAADPNMDSENYIRLYLAPKISDMDDE